MAVINQLKKVWNAFLGRDPTDRRYFEYDGVYSSRPDRTKLSVSNERSIVTAIYSKIAIDVSNVTIQHVRNDEEDRFKEVIEDGLNNCLTLEANLDQTNKAFFRDLVLSMFDEGCIAVAPIETNRDPNNTEAWDVYSLRVCKIVSWYPRFVKVRAYNENTGNYGDLIYDKRDIAIIENPFYAVMNENNSVAKRLIHKINLLDSIDEQSSSGKLDLLVQLPYTIKTEARRQDAEKRRKDIEDQLTGSKYGIAYIDATERVTQLNRAVDNNIMSQIEYLTSMLYSQLGITDEILNGKADEQTMLNYYNSTVEPILAEICNEFKRKFLSKTARSQHQSINYFRDPFKLVPVNQIADIADKFTRNEILTSNELRSIVGRRPVTNDPKADQLVNANLNQSKEEVTAEKKSPILDTLLKRKENQNGSETL